MCETNLVEYVYTSDAIESYKFNFCDNHFDSFTKFIFVISIDWYQQLSFDWKYLLINIDFSIRKSATKKESWTPWDFCLGGKLPARLQGMISWNWLGEKNWWSVSNHWWQIQEGNQVLEILSYLQLVKRFWLNKCFIEDDQILIWISFRYLEYISCRIFIDLYNEKKFIAKSSINYQPICLWIVIFCIVYSFI